MKRLCFPALILLILLLLEISISAEEKRLYPCYLLAQEPVLDGILKNDPVWRTVPGVTGFFRLGTGYYVSKQTLLKVAHTKEALYIGVECAEPEIEKIVAFSKNDDSGICLEDSVEIFIFPKGAGTYAQLMVNAIGSRWNRIRQDQPPKLSPDWQAVAYREEGYWSLEIKIPFAVLGRVPENQEAWTANVCRNILTSAGEDRLTSWAHLPDARSGFHAPDKFGVIAFENKTISPKEAGKIAGKMNLTYQKYLASEVKRTTGMVSNRKSGFTKKSRDPQLQQEILSLFKTCAEAKKQVSMLNLNTISIEKLHLLLNENLELLKRSDELEGRLLLENFFN